ncbi:MAG: inner membrane-spanning protein YciB [Caulobacterales bacterium]
MSKNETARGAGQLLIDLGPIIAFVLSFNVLQRLPADHPVHRLLGSTPSDSIFIATGVFIAATLFAVVYAWFKTRSVPPVLIVTAVLVVGFGGLTLALHDEGFVKIKPTVVNLFYAIAIFGSMLFGHNVWKLLFRHAFTLPDRVWKTLAVRWGLFFILMAVINEAIWRTQTTEFWVNSRLFITFPLVIVFALINLPLTMKYAGQDQIDPSADGPETNPKDGV